ncbi:MAG: ferrous iron transport protein A [Candidatus Omnitrophica bacterium]|nr:ferrous iron transport protein A [Candidatus Omnitrophota bacterium]
MSIPEDDRQIISLSAMSLGQRGEIVGFSLENEGGGPIHEMVLAPGEQVEIVRRAGPADAIEIKIRGYFLSLPKPQADLIKVKLLA